MNKKDIVTEVKNKLVEVYDPIAIYLFGEYTIGIPNEESDLEVLIVLKEFTKPKWEMLTDGYQALFNLDIPVNILLYDQHCFQEQIPEQSSFCHKITHNGEKIYEKTTF